MLKFKRALKNLEECLIAAPMRGGVGDVSEAGGTEAATALLAHKSLGLLAAW